jgi:hypothetical protein
VKKVLNIRMLEGARKLKKSFLEMMMKILSYLNGNNSYDLKEFESFVGDQHYPPPRGTPQAGPSGLVMTASPMAPCMNTGTMDGECDLVCVFCCFLSVSLTKTASNRSF